MKEYFPILSHYNTRANEALFAILAELPPEKLTEEVGSYFKSIYGVISHLYASDIAWLQRIRTTRPNLESLRRPELDVELSWPTKAPFATLGEFRPGRARLDAILTDLTGELTDTDLEAVIDYTNFRGKRARFICWQALMHLFNHQTHHRGQIAEILDQFGVENDYSNITATLTQPPL